MKKFSVAFQGSVSIEAENEDEANKIFEASYRLINTKTNTAAMDENELIVWAIVEDRKNDE